MFKSRTAFNGPKIKNPYRDRTYLGFHHMTPHRIRQDSEYSPFQMLRPHAWSATLSAPMNRVDERRIAQMLMGQEDLASLKAAGAPGYRSMQSAPSMNIKHSFRS